jgi:hypothetical protein
MNQPLLAAFAQDLAEWHRHVHADEWHFARAREKLVNSLQAPEAFAAIDDVVVLLLGQREEFSIAECGALLLALADRSQTTQMPRGLKNAWRDVDELLVVDAQVRDELRRWYRTPAA